MKVFVLAAGLLLTTATSCAYAFSPLNLPSSTVSNMKQYVY